MAASNIKIKNIKETIVGNKQVLEKILDFIPKKITFEIEHVHAMVLINTLRRVILRDVEAISLYCNDDDIMSTDATIIPKRLQLALRSIPIKQDMNTKNFKHTIVFKNNEDNRILIRGRDLFDKIKSKPFFNSSTRIENLDSEKKLTIRNLRIIKGVPKQHATFKLCAGYEYAPLNSKGNSLNFTPTHYRFGITTNGNIEPKDLIKMGCDKAVVILEKCVETLDKFKKGNLMENEDPLLPITSVYKEKNMYIYKIENETDTVGHLITRFMYNLDKNIPLCTYYVDDNSDDICYIKVVHSNHEKLFRKAISEAILCFNNIKKLIK